MSTPTPTLVETMNALVNAGEYRLAWKCFVLHYKQTRLTYAKERHNQKVAKAEEMARQLLLEIEILKFTKKV